MKLYPVRRHFGDSSLLGWEQAVPLLDFSSPWGLEVPLRTEFRALWDAERLHFRFDAWDDTPTLGAGAVLKERVLDSDRVEIFLTPDLSLRPYYCLEMSPGGEALVYRASFYREMDWEWSLPGLHVQGEMTAWGYRVEGSLPLAGLRDLSVLGADGRRMLAGLFRADFCREADGTLRRTWLPWVPPGTERPDFHVPEAFGMLELVD